MPGSILLHLDRAAVRALECAFADCASSPTAVDDPDRALDLLAQAPDRIAAVIVDAGIADPLRFVQRARGVNPNLSVVLAAGPGDRDDVRRALRLSPALGGDIACVALDDLGALTEAARAAVRARGTRDPRGAGEQTVADEVDPAVGRRLLAGDCGHLVDQAPIGVIAADATGGIRGWNRCARGLLDRSEREPLGYPLSLLFTGDQRTRLRMLLAAAVQGDSPEACTFTRTRGNGERQFLEVTASAHAGYAGAGALLLLQEVSARERARAERDGNEVALRESERRFRAVFEQAASGIALVSPEGTLAEVNERFCHLVGYGRDELTAMTDPIIVLTHPDDVDVELAYMAALVAGEGAPFQLEKRFRHRSGREVWSHLQVSALHDESGGMQQLIAVAESIDERKRAETALQASEERQRLILESLTNYAVFTTDLAGHVTDWNPGAERLLGYDESEIVGRSVDIIFPPEEREAGAPARELNEALEAGQSHDDRWHVRKDGTRFWASGLTHTLGSASTPRGFVKVLRDRTESKRSRDQLEARARQQDTVARFGQRALADLPLEQLFEEAVQLTATTLEVPLGALLRLLPGAHQLRLEAAQGWPSECVGVACIDAGRASHAGYTLLSGQPVLLEDLASESRFATSPLLRAAEVMSGISVAVPGSDGEPWGALQAYARQPRRFSEDDISFMESMANTLAAAIERHRTEQQLRELNQTLEQRVAERTAETEQRAAQLRALTSELTQTEQRERRRLAQVLHDNLQQMLVAGKLQVGTALKDTTDPRCTEALQRVDAMLDNSIEESRSLTVELSPPVLYDAGLVAGLEWLGRWMQEHHGLRLEVNAQRDIDPASEDLRVLFFQGARELLFNVVKHARVDHAEVRLRRDGRQRIEMQVRDAGDGFDASKGALAERQGEGFGLFSIRERLMRLEGEITVESAPGAGTCVTITVPESPLGVRDEDAGRAEDGQRSAADEPSVTAVAGTHEGVIRVVLADDHDLVREGLVGVLNAQSDLAVIGEAGDGRAAVELVRRDRPDVVVLDVTMPRMNGIEAARIIADECPGVRVIGLSVHESEDMAGAMRQAGAAAYLNKAGPSQHLLAAIRQPHGARAPSRRR